MVHGWNVASRLDLDRLAQFDGEGQQRTGLGTNLVCSDGTNGVDEPGVVAQTVDLFPGSLYSKFAVVFNEGGAPEVKRTQTVVDDVSL